MAYSRILNRHYDPSNNSVVYLTNMIQCYKYLQNGAESELVDILFTDTKRDCLVFVFKKSTLISDLYKKWQAHEL